ncbi:MAG: hypothetical protein JO056_04915 [Alphaproteobacteria bacterium]|nr:hypothetical protein [Alphaproteobacteria bacterium]
MATTKAHLQARNSGFTGTFAIVLALVLSGCGNRPTAHEAMQACYTQLNTQTPDWRKHLHERTSKVKGLVARYMALCMQDQRFKLNPRCSQMDERCYIRQPRFWERL